jgi:hypothetical protein
MPFILLAIIAVAAIVVTGAKICPVHRINVNHYSSNMMVDELIPACSAFLAISKS